MLGLGLLPALLLGLGLEFWSGASESVDWRLFPAKLTMSGSNSDIPDNNRGLTYKDAGVDLSLIHI